VSGGSGRPLRPRATAAVSVAPPLVSDLTAPQLVGLDARPFRDFLRAERIPHAVLGRRVVARLEHVLAAVDRLAATGEAAPLDNAERGDAEPTADAILARIGRRRA
jgi:hypothetical protein